MASNASGRSSNTVVYIEEPAFSRWLFGSSSAAWIWLVARLWLGWEWPGRLEQGLRRQHHLKFWDWGDSAYSLTGDGNIGWVRAGTVPTEDGAWIEGRRRRGLVRQRRPGTRHRRHPDIAYSWYVAWLEWLRDTGQALRRWSPSAEVVIGICLILGLFTGIMAFLGAILNFSFIFAGSAGVNPAMIVVSGMLILAWRNAGWYGLDRFVLPRLGTPGTGASCSAPAATRARVMTT